MSVCSRERSDYESKAANHVFLPERMADLPKQSPPGLEPLKHRYGQWQPVDYCHNSSFFGLVDLASNFKQSTPFSDSPP